MASLQVSSEKTIDFLIAGQGLAGTFLARALLERGKRVLVVDDGQRASSSRVAAGLLNPITGMRLRLAEGTPELLKTSKEWFARLERAHGKRFFTPMPIRRVYDSAKEIALKAQRYEGAEYAALMSEDCAPDSTGVPVNDALGSFVIKEGGWVDLPLLLDCEAEWLRGQGVLQEGVAHPGKMDPDGSGGVFWEGWHARQGVVFCNGYKAGLYQCWDWLPWQPAKGEIIDCQTNLPGAEEILNRGGWAIPLGEGRWRCGSTWEWKLINSKPTPGVEEELKARLEGFFKKPIAAKIVAHHAGVRPCVRGSHPFCGTHPELPWLHLFSGLGPKGTFWGPTCAQLLADWLCEGKPLPLRFDLRREVAQ